jgi:hypothetical protein
MSQASYAASDSVCHKYLLFAHHAWAPWHSLWGESVRVPWTHSAKEREPDPRQSHVLTSDGMCMWSGGRERRGKVEVAYLIDGVRMRPLKFLSFLFPVSTLACQSLWSTTEVSNKCLFCWLVRTQFVIWKQTPISNIEINTESECSYIFIKEKSLRKMWGILKWLFTEKRNR